MKNKVFKMAIITTFFGTLFFLTNCSKYEPTPTQIIKATTSKKIKMSPTVYAVPEKVPAISYGLNVRAKESIKRLYESPKDLDKMAAILKSEEATRIETNRKATSSKSTVPRVKSITFTATDYGTYYVCYAEANQPGPFDFYLINTNTWVYEYAGTSSGNSLYFYVDKPSLPGNYKVWYEGPNESNMTPGTQHMGIPYTGVTLISGKFYFESPTDMENLYNRLYDAYQDHSSAFFDGNSTLTFDQLDALITSTGFDEDYPFREFEGYFGFSSLRASLAAGEQQYLNGTITNDPDNDAPADDVLRTLVNTTGELTVQQGEVPVTAGIFDGSSHNPIGDICYSFLREVDIKDYASGKTVKIVGEVQGDLLFGRHVVSKTKSRKTKSGGGWKKYPATMNGLCSGTWYEIGCNNPTSYSTSTKSTRTRRVFLNGKWTLNLNLRYAFDGGFTSTHSINGNNYSLVLNRY